MNNDEMIWGVIGTPQAFCSFKAKLQTATFCRNQYNVSGICSRLTCPLANSRYATVLEKDGVCYLYMKTAERAHTPANLWERVKLSNNYMESLNQLDTNLQYWPRLIVHKCKQRLTKIRQYLIKARKLQKKARKKLVTINKKVDRREKVRESKAEKAAMVENKIKQELLDRLKKGVYEDDVVNIGQEWDSIMDDVPAEEVDIENDIDSEEEELESDEENEYEVEDDEDVGKRETVEEFVADLSDMEDYSEDEGSEEEESDSERTTKKRPFPAAKNNNNKKSAKPRVQIEFERETETSNTNKPQQSIVSRLKSSKW